MTVEWQRQQADTLLNHITALFTHDYLAQLIHAKNYRAAVHFIAAVDSLVHTWLLLNKIIALKEKIEGDKA